MRQHYATSDSLEQLSIVDCRASQADLDASPPGPLWKLYCATRDWDLQWSRERGGLGSRLQHSERGKLSSVSPDASSAHAIHVGTIFAITKERKGSTKPGEALACLGFAKASVTLPVQIGWGSGHLFFSIGLGGSKHPKPHNLSLQKGSFLDLFGDFDGKP